MMNENRSTTESNGRDNTGRFAKGNSLAKGNPFARQVSQLRAALLDAVTPEDIAQVVQMLVAKAKDGDMAAVKELLDRALGKARQPLQLHDEEDDQPVTFTLNLGELRGRHPIAPVIDDEDDDDIAGMLEE